LNYTRLFVSGKDEIGTLPLQETFIPACLLSQN